MLVYLSTQKLRTPKGLGWLQAQTRSADREEIPHYVMRLRDIFAAIWRESVWQIADAEQSETKFVISDHPVTVYNRRCGPRSDWCRGYNDPDIRFQATHTIFPLTLDKLLILTNSSWVRNPYQAEVNLRPNPNFVREALFDYTAIQTFRHLNEQEVLQINFIVKSRALRYIAAGKEEWLYPDRYISKSQWNEFGDGYLLMPDPRPIYPGGEFFLGYADGTTKAFDEYGRTPRDPEYAKENQNDAESNSLNRFKGEFARLYGPYRRGRSFDSATLDKKRDDDEFHQYHLSLENSKKGKNKSRQKL